MGQTQVYQNYKKQIQALSKKEALTLVKKYWAKDYFEVRIIALNILNEHIDKLTLSDMPLIEKLMKESGGWVFLDSLIIPIMPSYSYQIPKRIGLSRRNGLKVTTTGSEARHFWHKSCTSGKDAAAIKNSFFQLAKSQFDESWIDVNYKDALSGSVQGFL